jgi:hypothetical protein
VFTNDKAKLTGAVARDTQKSTAIEAVRATAQ